MNIAGRILVVDGMPTTRITMKVRLASACYEVGMAASGAEALRLVHAFRPQLVLIAAILPDMCTAQLCLQIRALPGCSDLPVLVQAQGSARIAALRAGASGLIDRMDDDLTLLARVRGLMRCEHMDEAPALPPGLSEPEAAFLHDSRPRAFFIAGNPATALGWRHALRGRMDLAISVCDPDRALADAAQGLIPELYLIAADLHLPGDGLRLLSELRSRPRSRDAGFVVMLSPARAGMTAVALDLGAGDVLVSELTDPSAATEAAIRLEAQLDRKRDNDRRRAEAQRTMRWALTDPLTGLPNRRHALPRLAELHAGAIERGDQLSVIVMDIDRFKRVNDGHGHAAGDAVLRRVTQRLAQALPAEALLARIGGEEFLALLPRHDARAAFAIAEEMRLRVQAVPVPLPAEGPAAEIHITLSAGVAALDHGYPLSGSEILLDRADRALLAAKTGGRNRIVLATASIAA